MSMHFVLAVVFGYLLGSLSFAVLVSYLMGLTDPRQYGSKNPGATNVLRSGNKAAAALTLLLDGVKGWLPVFLLQHWGQPYGLGASAVAIVGVAVFLGHLYPVFLRFKGGKGVATFFGVALGVDFILGLVALLVWLVVAVLFRYSSLSALAAAVFVPTFYPVFYLFSSNGIKRMDYLQILAFIIMVLLIILRHRANIARLFAGQEERIGGRPKAKSDVS